MPRYLKILLLTSAVLPCASRVALAQGPAYPLYCHGPLTTGAHVPPPSGPTSTPFKWAAVGAGAAAPGPGQCVWADRAAREIEILPGNGNAICDNSGHVAGVPAGTYLEVGVYRDVTAGNCMRMTHYVGPVTPPFSAVPALPPFVRQSIATLSSTQIASLRTGFQVMMSRPATDPTSYRFQADIHGTYDTATTPAQMKGWNQCEHGSYYFFSWHRMYLYYFERILRAASGDPNLALPYWNWSDASQRALPSPFRLPANSSNSLYIAAPNRPAAVDAGTAQLPASAVSFATAFATTKFDSPAGSGLSFGGQVASAEQFNFPHGELESQPHDIVHGTLAGLMGDPNTAAQDPVFWLHHANIDRLWKRWLDQGGSRQDPLSDAAWMNTTFTFFDEDGHAVPITGSEIIDTVSQLDYRYDDDPATPPIKGKIAPAPRIEVSERSAPEPKTSAIRTLATSRATAAGGPVELSNVPVTVSLSLPKAAAAELQASPKTEVPRTYILQLKNIQYQDTPGVYYEVYVNLPKGEKPEFTLPNYVGSLSFFALKPHAMAGHQMEGSQEVTRDFDISKAVGDLISSGSWNPDALSVTFVARGLVGRDGEPLTIASGTKGTFGSISLLTQ